LKTQKFLNNRLFCTCCRKNSAKLAAQVAAEVKIPVIGIGRRRRVDGQVLVSHDMLGINNEFNPRFLRKYQKSHKEC